MTVRVGAPPVEFAACIAFGIEQGFFQRAGLNIDLQPSGASSQTAAAIAGGSLDIAEADPLTVAAGHVRGVDFVYVAPGAGFGTPWPIAFATRMEDGIRDPKDFNGKTIAVGGLKSAPDELASDWLDVNGGDSSSVKWLEVPFSASVAAIAAKRVDGALLPEPFVAQARDAGLRITSMGPKSPQAVWMITGWIASGAWADRNTEIVRRFASAMREANRWANTHVRETLPIVSRYTKIPEAALAKMIPHPWIETLEPHSVQPILDICVKYGVLARPVPAKDIFYLVR
jgi:NitT/TauT family transport system substrate-binding protein